MKNMVSEFYDRPVIPELILETAVSTIHVENIWAIPDPIVETQK